ncbi:MAG: arginine--tRNA ligase [Phycisphaeraceae bacterium]|nr:arginine--tRNA ligase [Phycisphaeraceae bacterium]
MNGPVSQLREAVIRAMVKACGESCARIDPLLSPSANPQFGDYQANVAMSLAKQLGQKPRDVAQKIVDALDVAGLCSQVTIAGPGFINLRLDDACLSRHVESLTGDGRLGVERTDEPRTVVVDYSSPNVAKEMHVGHLRSTIIGDCIARVMTFQGHKVIRQNHLGDWGTQFGMLIEHLLDLGSGQAQQDASIGDLNTFYQQSKQHFDADADFAQRARQRVVKLQSGDEATLALWRNLIAVSYEHFGSVYQRLNVLLEPGDVRGESFYNPLLPAVVQDLEKLDLLRESQGAQVVYPDDAFKDKDGQPLPLIVRKSDGGYLYATTDLAAARFRLAQLGAQRVIYVTDARQAQHFAMVFATLRKTGWAPPTPEVRFDHVPFGTILGPDRKPFKTRDGGTVRLADLLDEAERRAADAVRRKNPELASSGELDRIASAVGIGAVKYADLSNDRIKDYVFDLDRMLAFEGNTGPYLQNAYVRIQSIFRKGGVDRAMSAGQAVMLDDPAERTLALKLLQWPGVVEAVAEHLEPHRLCNFLYDLASAYHQFYEKCPVLSAADAGQKQSRLVLCDLVARMLEKGLELLGIDVVEQM